MKVQAIPSSYQEVEIHPHQTIEALQAEFRRLCGVSNQSYITKEGDWAYWERFGNEPQVQERAATEEEVKTLQALLVVQKYFEAASRHQACPRCGI